MTQMSTHKPISWVLMTVFTVSLGLGGLGEAEAASKTKFKYALPDIDRWVKYCKREHPKMALKKCCGRRVAVCDNRCKKSRYPNTAYETKAECHKDCRSGSAQCQGLAELAQCNRVRDVVDHNVCCQTRHTECHTLCIKGGEVSKTCVNTCSRYRDRSCFKKYSKREYAKIQRKKHNPEWMATYCAKKADSAQCCYDMYDRSTSSCYGYPDTAEKINACQDVAVEANALCDKQHFK